MTDLSGAVNTDSTAENNVTAIADAKPRKNRRKPTAEPEAEAPSSEAPPAEAKPKATPFGILQRALMAKFLRQPTACATWPEPGVRFVCLLDRSSEKVLYQIDADGVCSPITRKQLTSLIAEYIDANLAWSPDYSRFESHHCSGTADLIMQTAGAAPAESAPRPWLFLSEPGECFWRVPFDIQHGAPQSLWPDWAELVSRLSNPRAFACYLASFYIPESFMEQYFWLAGLGRQGKGSIGGALAWSFGRKHAHVAQRPPRSDNKHWGVPFVDRRAMIYSDCKHPSMVREDWFMAVTGGDWLEIEPKFGVPFSSVAKCKIFCFSNVPPAPSDDPSDQERLLFSEIRKRSGAVDPRYKERLRLQLGAFLGGYCFPIYAEDCPTHGPIPNNDVSADAVSELGESLNYDFHQFVEANYTLAPSEILAQELKPAEMHALGWTVVRDELDQKIRSHAPWTGSNSNRQELFRTWLFGRGVRVHRSRLGGGARAWLLVGIARSNKIKTVYSDSMARMQDFGDL